MKKIIFIIIFTIITIIMYGQKSIVNLGLLPIHEITIQDDSTFVVNNIISQKIDTVTYYQTIKLEDDDISIYGIIRKKKAITLIPIL